MKVILFEVFFLHNTYAVHVTACLYKTVVACKWCFWVVLVLALGYRSGITIWPEIWRKTRNLQVMWFTAQQTAHKRYTRVQFSSSNFKSCMTFAVNLFLNNRPHWSCSSRNGAGLGISMAQGTEGKWDSTGHWCVLEYSPIYHENRESEPTLACVYGRKKKWKVGPIKDVSEDSLDWIALGRRAPILNPTSIKLGLVISSSLAHVKRLVINFYLFKHVKSCQCWFSWRISRASWQMSLMLFAAACNLGLLALAVLGFAICAELSFLMISPNPAEERFWRSWKQWEWWRNSAFLGLHGSFPAEGWEIAIIRDYLETRCSDQVSTKRNWLFQWALWQQFLKLQGMDGTGWEVNSDSAIGHWIVIGSLTAVSAAKQAPGSPEMPQCVEFMIFLYDLVKQGKRFYESHMCLVLFIWYS